MTYPLDFNKSLSSNQGVVSYINYDNQHRIYGCFAIPNVFFFGNTLTISYVDTNGDSINLIPNVDFKPIIPLDNISTASDGDNIYSAVAITNNAVSNVTLTVTCHLLGGMWAINESLVAASINQNINASQYHWAAGLSTLVTANINGTIKNLDITDTSNIEYIFNNGYGLQQVKLALAVNSPTSSTNNLVVIDATSISSLATAISNLINTSNSAGNSTVSLSTNSITALSTAIDTLLTNEPVTINSESVTNLSNAIAAALNGEPVSINATSITNLSSGIANAIATSLNNQNITINSASISNLSNAIATVLNGQIVSLDAATNTALSNAIATAIGNSAAQVSNTPLIGNGTIVTSNVLHLSSATLKSGMPIFALATNSDTVYVTTNASRVWADINGVSPIPTDVYPLAPGEAMALNGSNMNLYYIIGNTGDGVKWSGGI